ncbi:MAG TPA: alanine racemase [Candidatus Saccharimonadia bacterium]|nr:alanine racemase [Candidatus Saccharimonadia bacterium]
MLDRLVVAEIDLSAYAHNISILRSHLSAATKLMAVLKANAYGHGLVPIALHAEKIGVDYLGVVSLGEARTLRKAGLKLPILILNYIDPEGAIEAVKLHVDITVMDDEVLGALGKHLNKTHGRAKIHIKVDTGMHRAGVMPSDVLKFAQRVNKTKGITLQGLFMHFSTADDADLSFAKKQLDVFQSVIQELHENGIRPPVIHAANSAATLTLPQSHFSMVRPGIATYGLSPFGKDHPGYAKFTKQFVPILSLKTQIVQIRTIKVSESVGYGRTFIAKRKTRIALLPVGYGDGFRRAPQNAKEVLVRGKYAPILGRVSMDQTSIDITDIPTAKLHDEVVLIGTQGKNAISAEQVGDTTGTINYEVVTALSERVARTYKNL